MDRTQELEEQVRRLSQDVDEMRRRLAGLQGGQPEHANGQRRSNRRGFLRLGATAAAGALGWMAVKAVPAAAATGGNMILGSGNAAANPTTLQTTAAVFPTLGVEDSLFSQANLTTALTSSSEAFTAPLQGLGADGGVNGTEGIDGWASGATAYAVWGFTDTGTGVTGESLAGIGLYSRGTGRMRQDATSFNAGPGAPFGYTPNLMEQVRDAGGVLWIHNPTGVWRRVNTLRTDASDNSGGFFKPVRVLDTRNTGPIKAPGSVTSVQIAGVGAGASAIPADAVAVAGNLTAAAYTGGGFLTIMPDGITTGVGQQYDPTHDPASVNFQVGQGAIGNSFICGLNAGKLQVYVGGPPLPGHSSHFIIDITAYIQ